MQGATNSHARPDLEQISLVNSITAAGTPVLARSCDPTRALRIRRLVDPN
jgi:hypothetical protein